MAHLVWQDDLNTGIQVIDNQHKRIVEMINHLHDAQQGKEHAAIAEVIEELVDYTLSHFAFEETLMEDAGYQFSRAHKKIHELFIRRVSEYRVRFRPARMSAMNSRACSRAGCSTTSATTTPDMWMRYATACPNWSRTRARAVGCRAR